MGRMGIMRRMRDMGRSIPFLSFLPYFPFVIITALPSS
jgi:hypothetical protein